MPNKKANHHALARQWEILKTLPNRGPGITVRELADKIFEAGFSVTKRTIERDLTELSALFPLMHNDKGTPRGWHWMPGADADLPGLTLADALSLRIVEDLLRPLLPAAVLESLEPTPAAGQEEARPPRHRDPQRPLGRQGALRAAGAAAAPAGHCARCA